MIKRHIYFVCSKCDAQFPKWQGRCSECMEWGSIKESIVEKESKSRAVTKPSARVTKLSDVSVSNIKRIITGVEEIDRVLGGGIVPGAVYLVTGDPGVGKSTLLLHAAGSIHASVLYVSGEESIEQVKHRVERLGVSMEAVGFVSDTDIGTIASTIAEVRPVLTIVDSLQTIKDSEISQDAGSVSQMKAVTAQLVEAAKKNASAIMLVGHITKSGALAGPKTLEHLVDGVLYLEGMRHGTMRLLRATKNRFGSVDEVGVFEMTEGGLQEVKNPSKAFLSDQTQSVPGSVIAPIVEGSRVFFVEYQALVSRTAFGYPVRKSVGFDQNRLQMLIAVLQKRLHAPLHQFDVHVNAAGGMRFGEPAADAAVVAAVLSALRNKSLPANSVLFGEVGLAGEIRPVSFVQKRIKEARHLGFTRIIGPKSEQADDAFTVIRSVSDIGTLFA